jgi:hypothetical protein
MSAKDLQTRAEAWLKARMKRLTPRQRLGLVTVLLLVYAAVAKRWGERHSLTASFVEAPSGRRRFPPSNTSGSHYCRKGACYL